MLFYPDISLCVIFIVVVASKTLTKNYNFLIVINVIIQYNFCNMFEVRVEADFSAAHFLRDYNGKCEHLHGHNYKVFAHVRGEVLNEGGMLLDFSKLKATLREVCKSLDHTNLNDFTVFEQNPSAERIAFFVYNQIIEKIKTQKIDLTYSEKKQNAYLYSVDVFETETSRATYKIY